MKRRLFNFLTVGRHGGVSYTTGAEIKQVPGLTQQSLKYCKCRWEAKKTLRTGLKGENPCWVNKSSRWGTVFPGALCEVWLWTQTSFHYVATALEPPELGDWPCHLQPWAAGGCRGFSFSYFPPHSLPLPPIPFFTQLLPFNPALLYFCSPVLLPP